MCLEFKDSLLFYIRYIRMDPHERGYSQLNDFQQDIYRECIKKGSGGLSLPMGSGKTLLALLIGLEQTNSGQANPAQLVTLIVAAKTLIPVWEYEIQKFFGDDLAYEVLHPNVFKGKNKIDTWRISDKTRIILTTPETLVKYYKQYRIKNSFILQVPEEFNPAIFINYYSKPLKPYLNHTMGGGYLYSVKWGCFIVDEVQTYTKISTLRCQGLGAICASYRWVLSGTMFDEPTPERVLGYHIILNIDGMPRNLPETKNLIHSSDFRGIGVTTVSRKVNKAYKPPKVHEIIVTHAMTEPEIQVYITIKETIKIIQERLKNYQDADDHENARRFCSYLMAIITYLRQSLICPIIPLASIAVNMADYKKKSELSEILTDQIEKLGLNMWLQNVDNVQSSRIKKALDIINKHNKEQIVIFSCFRTCLEMLQYYLPKDRPVLSIQPNMSMNKRGELVEQFQETDNGILLLTYTIGSNGLNLQSSHVELLLDFWWNAGKTQQAIARLVRYGQMAKEIHIYYFTSNTGVEKALFTKQKKKLIAIGELNRGPIKTKIPRFNMQEVIRFIQEGDNEILLHSINNH